MRVLQVLPTLGYGGVARVVLDYREQLMHQGVQMDFITHGGVEAYHANLQRSGSRVFYLEPINQVGVLRYFHSLRAVRPRDYDIVHIHTGHVVAFYGLLFVLLGQSRCVLHAHTTVSVNERHNALMPALRALSMAVGRGRLACGRNAGDFCFGPARYAVIHNGLDLQRIVRMDRGAVRSMRDSLFLREDQLVLGQVGRFTPEKNHRFSLDLLQRILAHNRSARLLFVGDGPLRREIEEIAHTLGVGQHVSVLGNRPDVYELMQCMDALLLPSLFEGMPMVAVESQAVGTPVLVSDVVDPDIDLGIGLVQLLPLNAPGTWVDAIEQLAEQANPAVDEVKIRNRFVEVGYDASAIARQLLDVYLGVSGLECPQSD